MWHTVCRILVFHNKTHFDYLKFLKAFFGEGIESLPEDITLEDLLSGEGFDLRYTNEQRFQKLRQFRRLVRYTKNFGRVIKI